MKCSIPFIAISFALATTLRAQEKTKLQSKQATGHLMQYFVSLPQQWDSKKKWPVIIVLEAAEKQYKTNADRFVKARGSMPFIIVAPIHTGNGNMGRRDPQVFPYSNETWDYIEKVTSAYFS